MMFLKHEATQKAKAHEQQRRLQKELELVKVILYCHGVPRLPSVAVVGVTMYSSGWGITLPSLFRTTRDEARAGEYNINTRTCE